MTTHAHPVVPRSTTWRRRLLLTIEVVVAVNDSYVIPSLILLVAVGGGMSAAAVALLARHRLAPEMSTAAGLILIGWISVQVLVIVPKGGFSWLQPTMLAAGALVAAVGWQLRNAHPRLVLLRADARGALAARPGAAAPRRGSRLARALPARSRPRRLEQRLADLVGRLLSPSHATHNQEEVMTTAQDTGSAVTGPRAVLSRGLVGIDGSEESREAARQAATLTEGELTLLAVYDTVLALVATTGMMPPPYIDLDLQRDTAEDALRRVRAELGDRPASGKIVKGCSWEELIREVEREHDTLIAIGTHGNGRARGIVMGSTATELIHKAPCSVLVSRDAGKEFPRKIVVGVDGSPESAAAYAAARHLAERFGAELWPVVAHGGKGVDKSLTAMIVRDRHEDLPDEPVSALVAASADADLLVIGSRGLHGLKALGSVSERVAHQARSSVLIVREPAWQQISEELEQ